MDSMTDNTKKFTFNLQLFADGEEYAEPTNDESTNVPEAEEVPTVTSADTEKPEGKVDGEQDNRPETEAPETYDFTPTWGDAKDIDQEMLGHVEKQFKELGLNNEQANALMKLAMGYGNSIVEKSNAQQLEKLEAMAKETKKALGKNFQSTLSMAGQGIEVLEKDIPGLRDWFDETGFGNDLTMIRIMEKFGAMVAEDGGHLGKGVKPMDVDPYKSRWPNSLEMLKEKE